MSKSALFNALVKADQQDLPIIGREIDSGVSVHNTKDRIRELHAIISILVRYTIIEDADKQSVDLSRISAITSQQQQPALLPSQHFPATGHVALDGAPPPLVRQQIPNVIVGNSLPLGGQIINAGLEAPEPEASDVIEVVVGRAGTKVIPPRGSGLAPQTFVPGQIVDATKAVVPGLPTSGQG